MTSDKKSKTIRNLSAEVMRLRKELLESQEAARPTGTSSAHVIQLIKTEAMRGRGVDDDPCRTVVQYWTLDGELICTADPCE